MAVQNSTILERVWLEASNDFQQRIPNPSINGYAEAVSELFEPYNHDLFNQFANMLVGMMGTYVESKLFENPLRELKKPARTYGNTERGVAVKYLQAHSPKVDDETLLKLEKPEFREWFYSVSPGRRYEFSWSIYDMRRVFNDPDGYGYDELLSATLTQTRSSDNYDEMTSMIQMFAEGDQRLGGLFRRSISAAPTDKATGQELLAKIKADAGRLRFPSMLYNHIDIPVFESSDTLILWVTPDTDANLDVYALAELFNVDRAEVRFRKIVIPEFPIPNVYAALTSEDFIYCRDVWYGIEPPFYNPANRTYKYYLFHDQMLGVNPVANCILYTTDEEDVIPTVTMEVTGLAFSPNTADVLLGGSVKLDLELQGTVNGSDGKIAVEPDAGMFSVAATRTTGGETPETQAVALNSRTYVDDYGVLHTQKSGLQVGDVITVTAKSAYINPSAATTEYTATATVTVVAAEQYGAKECPVEEKPYIEYTDETESVTASE